MVLIIVYIVCSLVVTEEKSKHNKQLWIQDFPVGGAGHDTGMMDYTDALLYMLKNLFVEMKESGCMQAPLQLHQSLKCQKHNQKTYTACTCVL